MMALAAQPDPLFVEAVKLHQLGQLGAAVEKYRAVLKHSPGSVEARSNLGAALAALGRYEEAITEYRQALRAAPGHPALRLNLGLAYFKAERVKEAIVEFSALRKAKPRELQSALLLANCHTMLGDYKAVIAVLEPMAKDNAQDDALNYLLGTALIRESRVAEGQALADRILRRSETAEAHVILGSALLRGARFPDAIRELERALALNPKIRMANALMAQARNESGDRAGAMSAYRAELELDPNNYNANFELGVLLKDDRLTQEALPFFERAAKLRPDEVAAPYQVAMIDLAEGRFDKARVALERIVRQQPKFAQAHAGLAAVYVKLGRLLDARREHDIAASLAAGAQ
jgi:tetratricopeptide (TPR) repeat protein